MRPTELEASLLFEQLGGYISLVEYQILDSDPWNFRRIPGVNGQRRYEGSVPEFMQFYDTIRSLYRGFRSVNDFFRWADVYPAFEEILKNAIEKGSQMDPQLSVSLKIIECADAYVLRVRDSGPGFEVHKVLHLYDTGQVYYNDYGHGIPTIINADAVITYENNGNTWNIVMVK